MQGNTECLCALFVGTISEVLFVITNNSSYFESFLCAQCSAFHLLFLFNHNSDPGREVTILPIF